MNSIRKIIHIDMDAFFASVEQRDQPEYRGRPVIVGGSPDSRGVVCTASYEARRFGVHSAMSSAQAYRLCPQGIFLPPRFQAYKQVSMQIREIFFEYTDLVEPLSLDEAYLDVTRNRQGMPSATIIAQEIRRKIREETGLTSSAGVSFNKFLAKVASDVNKPDGIKVVPPEEAEAFIAALPIENFYGVGKVTARKMRQFGIRTGADLKRFRPEDLIAIFGKNGWFYYEIAHGIDRRKVCPVWNRKSIGKEVTLEHDIDDIDDINTILHDLAAEVAKELQRHRLQGKTVTLKVKYADFQSITRSKTQAEDIAAAAQIVPLLPELLAKTEAGSRKVRLLGITVSSFPAPIAAEMVYQPELPF
ncbi:MAG: DNA polymerase IV [Victivallales bacterium]|nr:DNA polymerase IV [Victivallales bacterium]